MAFTTPYELESGIQLPAAYVNITVNTSKALVTCICSVYASAETKEEGKPKVLEVYHQFPVEDKECSNPLDYGYQLLESSGLYPEATWNV